MTKPPNPPAFPFPSDGVTHGGYDGMTLLDYFAGQAFPAVYTEAIAFCEKYGYAENWQVKIAADTYRMAALLLTERERVGGGK